MSVMMVLIGIVGLYVLFGACKFGLWVIIMRWRQDHDEQGDFFVTEPALVEDLIISTCKQYFSVFAMYVAGKRAFYFRAYCKKGMKPEKAYAEIYGTPRWIIIFSSILEEMIFWPLFRHKARKVTHEQMGLE